MWVGHDYLGLGKNPNNPPPNSWASDPTNDVVICHITIQPGGSLTLPKAHESTANRSLYYIEGSPGALVDGIPIKERHHVTLEPTVDGITLEVPEGFTEPGEFLWMQGKPIQEPKVSYGPFVMNTQQEIYQAFMDYEDTQFGGWPWPRDDMVFPAEKGRFALFDGKETTPPTDDEVIKKGDEKKVEL
jgi:redox-sensitive bicupin YhaK (pirin superfamily)